MMHEITKEEAKTLVKYGNVQVFGLYDDGSESDLYYNPEGINDFERFAVERVNDD